MKIQRHYWETNSQPFGLWPEPTAPPPASPVRSLIEICIEFRNKTYGQIDRCIRIVTTSVQDEVIPIQTWTDPEGSGGGGSQILS